LCIEELFLTRSLIQALQLSAQATAEATEVIVELLYLQLPFCQLIPKPSITMAVRSGKEGSSWLLS
jgi:hypothetical protein